METQVMIPDRKRRSVKLTKEELAALKLHRKKFNTQVECAISLGIDRLVMNNVLLKGSGSPDTISKIRSVLSNEFKNNVQ